MKIVKIILAATVCTAIIAAMGCTKMKVVKKLKKVMMILLWKVVNSNCYNSSKGLWYYCIELSK